MTDTLSALTTREIEEEVRKMTPKEVPVGTSITLRKVENGWTAIRFSPMCSTLLSKSHISSKSRNLILALKKVIEIY